MTTLPMNLSTRFAAIAKRLTFCTSSNCNSRALVEEAAYAERMYIATITLGLGNGLTIAFLVVTVLSRPNERLRPRTVARGPVASMHNLGNLYHQIGHVPLSRMTVSQCGLFQPVVRLEGRQGDKGILSFIMKPPQFVLRSQKALSCRECVPLQGSPWRQRKVILIPCQY
jgi:hypothetical protein